MIIDDKKLLIGFFMNKERDPDGEYKAGLGLHVSAENYKLACDILYTLVADKIETDEK